MLLRRCQNTRGSLCSASAVVVDLVQEYGKNCVKENKRHPFSQESEVDSQKFSSTTEIMDAMKEMFRDVLQQVMESELDTELGYAKSQRMSAPSVVNKPRNYRNGYSKKTLKTQLGAADVRVPWDRNGEYEPQIIGKYSRNADGMEEKVLGLYACGMSQRDIAEQIKELYNELTRRLLAEGYTPEDTPPGMREYSSCVIHFLIKSFNYPISARDTGADLVRQRASSNAQSLDNFFQRSKYFVMESTLSNFFPNLFNRVHFRPIWWDIEKDNIIMQI